MARQATSEDEPAQATFTAGAHSVGGSPTAELEMQSHPSPYTPPHHAAPQPAVAVVMPSGATGSPSSLSCSYSPSPRRRGLLIVHGKCARVPCDFPDFLAYLVGAQAHAVYL